MRTENTLAFIRGKKVRSPGRPLRGEIDVHTSSDRIGSPFYFVVNRKKSLVGTRNSIVNLRDERKWWFEELSINLNDREKRLENEGVKDVGSKEGGCGLIIYKRLL